jgi:hypothetical protein
VLKCKSIFLEESGVRSQESGERKNKEEGRKKEGRKKKERKKEGRRNKITNDN